MISKKFTNNALWWLDLHILNLNNIIFLFSKTNNIYYLDLQNNFLSYMHLLNKFNLSGSKFFTLDKTIYDYNSKKNYYIAIRSIFFDFQLLIKISTNKEIQSVSSIYSGDLWVERELREMSGIHYKNLQDSRKLLLNYNYNQQLQYNQYNNIIEDIQV